jgi:hypothetical protein
MPFYPPTRKGNNKRKYSSEYCSKIHIEKVFLFRDKNADAPEAFSRHYEAPVLMALYNQGSGIPVIQINRMRPRPKKGAWLA